jgi:hypothetical protein
MATRKELSATLGAPLTAVYKNPSRDSNNLRRHRQATEGPFFAARSPGAHGNTLSAHNDKPGTAFRACHVASLEYAGYRMITIF